MACKKEYFQKPLCVLPGECFARQKDMKCKILSKSYKDYCPFQKEDRDVTNGVRYKYNPEEYEARITREKPI